MTDKQDFSLAENNYREIITKAVCGTGKKDFHYTTFLSLREGCTPTQILGSSVTRLKLTQPLMADVSSGNGLSIRISGTLDINVWYAYNNNQATDVAKETVNFTEIIPITEVFGKRISQLEPRAILVKNPQCLETVLDGDSLIRVEMEMGIYAEIIGETNVCVQVFSIPGSSGQLVG